MYAIIGLDWIQYKQNHQGMITCAKLALILTLLLIYQKEFLVLGISGIRMRLDTAFLR